MRSGGCSRRARTAIILLVLCGLQVFQTQAERPALEDGELEDADDSLDVAVEDDRHWEREHHRHKARRHKGSHKAHRERQDELAEDEEADDETDEATDDKADDDEADSTADDEADSKADNETSSSADDETSPSADDEADSKADDEASSSADDEADSKADDEDSSSDDAEADDNADNEADGKSDEEVANAPDCGMIDREKPEEVQAVVRRCLHEKQRQVQRVKETLEARLEAEKKLAEEESDIKKLDNKLGDEKQMEAALNNDVEAARLVFREDAQVTEKSIDNLAES